ncbi:MAG: UvrB/UvrC protein [Bryobacterales bacterium]|nr:UvrB/UvrC protein [Bryobacterales bacterium]
MEVTLDERAIAEVPDRPAVFLLTVKDGEPYLARTRVLRRRLLRLCRMEKVRDSALSVEYWPSGSTLESQVTMYELARRYFPDHYADFMHLRMPPYVRLLLANEYPRSHITSHFGRQGGFYFGPFRSRASAERFESHFLDLFQMRRCLEDLTPFPDHPGCLYGEMAMCLRPCQGVVGPDEYRHEVNRAAEFLSTGGLSLLNPAISTRDRYSEEMDFEQAARQHKRIEKIEEVRELRDEMVRQVDRLHGVAVTQSAAPNSIELSFVRGGHWQETRRVSFDLVDGKPVSLDQKLREAMIQSGAREREPKERQEYLAILSRWFYSSWRDGELVLFDSLENPPYRKLVHAISRVHRSVV